MSNNELWELLRGTAQLQRLLDELRISDAAGTTTAEQEREYRLRRAALAQRHLAAAAETGSDPVEARADAEETAKLLWDHDALHGSHRGPRPATDPVWQESTLHDYVRQEAEAAGLTSL